MKVELTFTEPVLGTQPGDPKIHEEFIASNAPDALTRKEEIELKGKEEVIEKSMTVFPKDEKGNPFIWDYQIKGFFKDACSSLARASDTKSSDLKAHKKVIDGVIFVFPRRIPINMNGMSIENCQRPLRAETAQGPRICLANSEEIPAGASIQFEIKSLDKKFEKYIVEWLDYGALRGLGQWRNSGKGRFEYKIV